MILYPLYQEITGSVFMPISARDKVRDSIFLMKDKTTRVKGMRRLFICQEGQFPGIRREKFIGIRLPAHLGHIHGSGICDQYGTRVHFFQREEYSVMPVHIRQKIMKGDYRET